MKKVKQQAGKGLVSKLIRYSAAVGTGALLSPLAFSDLVQFEPDGGLPIVIDTDNTEDKRVFIDIDGDQVDDFSIYYNRYGYDPDYGGGFFIEKTNAYNGIHHSTFRYYNRAMRNDLTEYVCVARPPNQFPDYASFRSLIDADEVIGAQPPYTPFRDRPGFLGLRLAEDYDSGFAAALKVVVNSDGTEVTILKGTYRTDTYDLRLDDGSLLSDGFESPPASDYFPPAIRSLAIGSSE